MCECLCASFPCSSCCGSPERTTSSGHCVDIQPAPRKILLNTKLTRVKELGLSEREREREEEVQNMKSTGFTVSHILNVADESDHSGSNSPANSRDLNLPPARRERSDGIKVDIVLQEADLWRKFHSLVNEMIVTKNGRFVYEVMSPPHTHTRARTPRLSYIDTSFGTFPFAFIFVNK